MRILWIPHAPLGRGRTRSDHLIERLARRHEISVVSFHTYPTRQWWRYLVDLITHRSRQTAHCREVALWRFPRLMRLNSWILNRVIDHELSRAPYDVLIAAPTPFLTGYPDFARLRTRIKLVCDYVDGGDWVINFAGTHGERDFVRSMDAVLCVSHGLVRQAKTLNPHAHYVPNGVELSRYQAFRSRHSTAECKRKLGLDPDTFVASIIGMTCADRLYFVDAFLELARRGRKILLLGVGDTALKEPILARAAESPAIRLVGRVPYEAVLDYFMASDLGLYVVDHFPYYNYASPLKIFEYGAMGKPVLVAPPLDEVARMKLPFVRTCEAESDAVVAAIEAIMDGAAPADFAIPTRYDWDAITADVETICQGLVESGSAVETPAADDAPALVRVAP